MTTKKRAGGSAPSGPTKPTAQKPGGKTTDEPAGSSGPAGATGPASAPSGPTAPNKNPAKPQPVHQEKAGGTDPGAAGVQPGAPAAPAPAATGSAGGDGTKPLGPRRQSAMDWMAATLKSWGLGDLAGHVRTYLTQGLGWQEIELKLQDTQEWKTRFAGNIAREKAGLKVLNPAEYLAMEEQYHQTLRQFGLPSGFYDDKKATDNWIGNDVSAAELGSRVQQAADLVNGNPNALQQWNRFYGGGKGGAIAAILDPKVAESVVSQRVAAAEIGGSALDQGLNVNRGRAEQFAKFGLTLAGARQAYSQIAQRVPTDQSVAARFGQTFGQAEEENSTILGDAKAAQRQNLLYSEEAAQFGGHGGASAASNNAVANF